MGHTSDGVGYTDSAAALRAVARQKRRLGILPNKKKDFVCVVPLVRTHTSRQLHVSIYCQLLLDVF